MLGASPVMCAAPVLEPVEEASFCLPAGGHPSPRQVPVLPDSTPGMAEPIVRVKVHRDGSGDREVHRQAWRADVRCSAGDLASLADHTGQPPLVSCEGLLDDGAVEAGLACITAGPGAPAAAATTGCGSAERCGAVPPAPPPPSVKAAELLPPLLPSTLLFLGLRPRHWPRCRRRRRPDHHHRNRRSCNGSDAGEDRRIRLRISAFDRVRNRSRQLPPNGGRPPDGRRGSPAMRQSTFTTAVPA